MEIRGRTALVTGGAVRVGRAISLALAGAGARLLVHHHSSIAEAEELVGSIRSAGGEAEALRADLRDPAEVERLAAEAEGIGPVDLLINNASIFPEEGFLEVDLGVWEEAIAVNLRAPFFLAQRIGERMKRRGAGVIVNVADLAGLQVWKDYAAHGIAKAGLVQLTRVAARSLAPEVRVVGIAPGTVLPPEQMGEQEVRRLAERAPLRRIGSAEDVANAVLYLVGADFVTGEVLVVDGGRQLG